MSSVSHELKTPLAAATARVTGLLDEDAAPTPRACARSSREVADDLARLNASIGDLLDLSRLESDAWRPQLRDARGRRHPRHARSSRLPAARARARALLALAETRRSSAATSRSSRARSSTSSRTRSRTRRAGVAGRRVVRRRAASDDRRSRSRTAGPGVPDAEKERVFDKFYRGAASVDGARRDRARPRDRARDRAQPRRPAVGRGRAARTARASSSRCPRAAGRRRR